MRTIPLDSCKVTITDPEAVEHWMTVSYCEDEAQDFRGGSLPLAEYARAYNHNALLLAGLDVVGPRTIRCYWGVITEAWLFLPPGSYKRDYTVR